MTSLDCSDDEEGSTGAIFDYLVDETGEEGDAA